MIPNRIPAEITKLFRPSPFDKTSAVLLRREPPDPSDTANWCLMIFEDVDFEDGEIIGTILIDVTVEGKVFTVQRDYRTDTIVAINKSRLESGANVGWLSPWLDKLMPN